jgi:HAMP domain-containing protein
MSNNTEIDTLVTWAARGLAVAQRGLEASARWLDARAKALGELATKLATPPAENADAAPAADDAPANAA